MGMTAWMTDWLTDWLSALHKQKCGNDVLYLCGSRSTYDHAQEYYNWILYMRISISQLFIFYVASYQDAK